METCTDLVSLLRSRAADGGQRRCYTFLGDGKRETDRLTHADLDRAAATLAARLVTAGSKSRNVLLAYPPGLEFVVAFFGCLYAGFVPVPVALPHPRRGSERIPAIAADCEADLILSTAAGVGILCNAAQHAPALHRLRVLETGLDTDGEGIDEPVHAAPDALAFLQYTSGSTRAPRGVCVAHGNVLANLASIAEAERTGPDSRGVSWLPTYHDMGLIEGILAPLYGGYDTTLLPHGAFLQRPLRWLQAISRLRATVSGGPNFAFDACVRRVSEMAVDELDLSTWAVAYCGAEPVRAATLRAFADRFARCGFRAAALRPVYGLAEATLLVAASNANASTVRVAQVDKVALDEGRFLPAVAGERSQDLVSCGPPGRGTSIAIVDPESTRALPAGCIGEILVAGPNVAKGYFGQVQRSSQVFIDADIGGISTRWLRTGDLGCIHQGELYVAGRVKDVVIVRGRKLHPQDIEYGVQRLDPHRIAAVAVFGHDDGRGEGAAVLIEMAARMPVTCPDDAGWGRLADEIRTAVYQAHEVSPTLIAFVTPGALTRTSSGKLVRYRCRKNYLEGQMTVLSRFDAPSCAPHITETA